MSPQAIRLDLAPGTLYRCLLRLHGSNGHLYRVLGVALHYPSQQENIVYEGVDGPDAGQLFVCTFHDFAVKFCPAAPLPIVRPADPPATGWCADFTSRGKY